MILECLEKILHRNHLTSDEAAAAMEEILSGQATDTQTAALLVSLSMKGEQEEELYGMAVALRGKTYLFDQYGTVDVGLSNSERGMLLASTPTPAGSSGTIGPGSTFNIASAVAFVVAGAGVRVLQQGHRSSNSDLESGAVLEALGINTRTPPFKVAQCIAEEGLGFVFEPVIPEAMERLQFAFREIPIPTVFNLLLPMLNPGAAPALALGVHSESLTGTVARVLSRMGVRRAFVFYGSDGLDEITHTGPTVLAEVKERVVGDRTESQVQVGQIEPGDFGIPAGRLEDLEGGDAKHGAEIIRAVLGGEKGPRRNVVVLNAAPGIVCGGKAGDLSEGVRVAAESIDSGRALRVLERLAEFTNRSE